MNRARRCRVVRGAAVLVLTTTVGLSAAPAAVAAPPPTEVVDVALQSGAPGGQLRLVARGFAPREAASVRLVDPTSGADVATLAPITTNGYGVVLNPAGYRFPGTVAPGQYLVTVAQASGATATWPEPVVVAAPSVQTWGDVVGGQTLGFVLAGLSGAPDIARSLTIDGRPAALSAVTEPLFTDRWGSVTAATPIPTDLAVGRHTLALTQASAPATTVTTGFTVATPSLAIESEGSFVPPLGAREQVVLYGGDFAAGRVSVTATAADGRTYPLPDLDASHRSTSTLPGLPAGPVRFRAVSAVNGSVAVIDARVMPAAVASPGTADLGQFDNGLFSPDGRTRLYRTYDGGLVLDRGGQRIWSATIVDDTGDSPTRLAVQTDGNVVAYGYDGRALWNTRTATTDTPVTLSVLDEGRAVLTTRRGGVLWTTPSVALSTLPAGASMAAGARLLNDRYAFVVQPDGNAVLYGGGKALFATGTARHPGAVLKLQTDGNLVLYSTTGAVLWTNRGRSGPGGRLVMQPDGNLVQYAANGRAVWATGTAGR